MDQKEIDDLLKTGNVKAIKKEQINHSESQSDNQNTPVVDPDQSLKKNRSVHKKAGKGEVIGQLSKVTEESETGTNIVMNYMENILATLEKQSSFIKTNRERYSLNPSQSDINLLFDFMQDTNNVIEDIVFNAMDAFQFQDIGRQKLMKVMHTLAKLNQYLNELLGYEEKSKSFGKNIEEKTLEQDKNKGEVDTIVADFQKNQP